MRATIDKAGRLVIPKALRDSLGLQPGPVELYADGTVLRVEPVITEPELVERDGRLHVRTPGFELSDEQLRALRLADQR